MGLQRWQAPRNQTFCYPKVGWKNRTFCWYSPSFTYFSCGLKKRAENQSWYYVLSSQGIWGVRPRISAAFRVLFAGCVQSVELCAINNFALIDSDSIWESDFESLFKSFLFESFLAYLPPTLPFPPCYPLASPLLPCNPLNLSLNLPGGNSATLLSWHFFTKAAKVESQPELLHRHICTRLSLCCHHLSVSLALFVSRFWMLQHLWLHSKWIEWTQCTAMLAHWIVSEVNNIIAKYFLGHFADQIALSHKLSR